MRYRLLEGSDLACDPDRVLLVKPDEGAVDRWTADAEGSHPRDFPAVPDRAERAEQVKG